MSLRRLLSATLGLCVLAAGCASPPQRPATPAPTADRLRIVHCLLPGQVRKLGAFATGISPRRPAKISAAECEDAGGEYVVPHLDAARALGIWLPFAQQGDAQAQVEVGELYERGVGAVADHATAAQWYRRAAEQGSARGMINLASLYERGLGVERNAEVAGQLFRRASGLRPAPSRLSIHLIDPAVVLSPGERAAIRLAASKPPHITGRVVADHGIARVMVDGQAVAVDEQGFFKVRVPLQQRAPVPMRIAATDGQGHVAQIEFNLSVEAHAGSLDRSVTLPSRDGSRHALLIVNQHYRHWESLDTPLHDAQDMKALLERRYGFEVTLLKDATRLDMFTAFQALRARLSPQDKLVVFYAGHGAVDPVTQRGYWIPVDGARELQSDWVSVADITDQLSAIQARQVLVIADSCYSGTMAQSELPSLDASASAWQAVQRLRTRVVLASGRIEPVPDTAGGRNSPFARTLLDVLNATHGPIEARRVYEEVSARIALHAPKSRLAPQPQYAPIRFAGHEGGDFVFMPEP